MPIARGPADADRGSQAGADISDPASRASHGYRNATTDRFPAVLCQSRRPRGGKFAARKTLTEPSTFFNKQTADMIIHGKVEDLPTALDERHTLADKPLTRGPIRMLKGVIENQESGLVPQCPRCEADP